ncbi:hypothetical protein ACGVWS_11565 [Enterobacteriaceae bacterium LUAb1]
MAIADPVFEIKGVILEKIAIFITFSSPGTGQNPQQLLYYYMTQLSVDFSCKGNIDVQD